MCQSVACHIHLQVVLAGRNESEREGVRERARGLEGGETWGRCV